MLILGLYAEAIELTELVSLIFYRFVNLVYLDWSDVFSNAFDSSLFIAVWEHCYYACLFKSNILRKQVANDFNYVIILNNSRIRFTGFNIIKSKSEIKNI